MTKTGGWIGWHVANSQLLNILIPRSLMLAVAADGQVVESDDLALATTLLLLSTTAATRPPPCRRKSTT